MDHCRVRELDYISGPRNGSILETKILLFNVCGFKPFCSLCSKKEEQALLIFERKIFRRIYGLNMKKENGKVGRIKR
jgi:hypothetical protein